MGTFLAWWLKRKPMARIKPPFPFVSQVHHAMQVTSCPGLFSPLNTSAEARLWVPSSFSSCSGRNMWGHCSYICRRCVWLWQSTQVSKVSTAYGLCSSQSWSHSRWMGWDSLRCHVSGTDLQHRHNDSPHLGSSINCWLLNFLADHGGGRGEWAR